jgi:hypothetical protein
MAISKRKYEGSIRCICVYPTEQSSDKQIETLKSVGMSLTPGNAKELGELLQSLAAKCPAGAIVDVTAWREKNQVSVSQRPGKT